MSQGAVQQGMCPGVLLHAGRRKAIEETYRHRQNGQKVDDVVRVLDEVPALTLAAGEEVHAELQEHQALQSDLRFSKVAHYISS